MNESAFIKSGELVALLRGFLEGADPSRNSRAHAYLNELERRLHIAPAVEAAPAPAPRPQPSADVLRAAIQPVRQFIASTAEQPEGTAAAILRTDSDRNTHAIIQLYQLRAVVHAFDAWTASQ